MNKRLALRAKQPGGTDNLAFKLFAFAAAAARAMRPAGRQHGAAAHANKRARAPYLRQAPRTQRMRKPERQIHPARKTGSRQKNMEEAFPTEGQYPLQLKHTFTRSKTAR